MNPEQKPIKAREIIESSTLALAVDYLRTQDIAPHESVSIDAELVDEIRLATATPFREVERVSIGHLPAEYDTVDNTVYPETFSATVYGWFGDMDSNERSISFVIAHDPHTNTYSGFVAQSFHDATSYPLDESIGVDGLMRSVASHLDTFRDTSSDPIITGLPVGDDYKRTEDIRLLEAQDLELLLQIVDQHSSRSSGTGRV